MALGAVGDGNEGGQGRPGDPVPAPEVGACGEPATMIHAVQGRGGASPRVGQTVVVEAVVVGDFQAVPIEGLFLQEQDGDADDDPLTSEGLFVYRLPIEVDEGELLRVLGTVAEHRSLTELEQVVEVVRCGTIGLPAETVVELPVVAVSHFEALEGMRVRFPQTLTVTDNHQLGRFGSLDLAAGGRLYQPTQVVTPGANAAALADLNDRSRMVLDDASTVQNPDPIPYMDDGRTRRIGDRVENLAGILSGRFGRYRVQPTVMPRFVRANPRPQGSPDVGGDLRVAVFNLRNFFTTADGAGARCGPGRGACRGADTAAELERQRHKLLAALEGLDADIIALNEVENNGSQSTRVLVEGLNERLGADASGGYGFVDTGVIGTDAVKVAFLYRSANVRPVGPPAMLDGGVDARFLDHKNRPSLAQRFVHMGSGRHLTVVNNHLKSKGTPCDDVGDPDAHDGQGHCNGTRTAAAAALVDWLATDPTGGDTDDMLIVGDLNAYGMETPMITLKGAGYEALVDAFIGPGASSFVFAGESGCLTHALASRDLADRVTGVAFWSINADEPPVLDYNLEYKTQDPFDGGRPFRASDHDPLVIGLQLGRPCASPPKASPP